MKKILALSLFLLVTAACTNQTSTSTNMASNTNTTPTRSAPPTEADITGKEKAVWDTLKKKDIDAFGNMLTADYIEVTDEGVLDKAGIVAGVKDFNVTDTTFSDWKMIPIDSDAVILTYTLNLKATYNGKDLPPGPYRAAAVWLNRGGKWLAFFYQQTAVKTTPPPPAPAATAKKGPASPGVVSGQPGPDPIANEKLVWDTFKNNNSEAFGAMLDPGFVEIEGDAVYDKAASVKSIANMDASQFELSEWKSAKLDNDAALVTYLVKPKDPKWDPERHTSIWISRGGKWVALLHMGTPVAKPAEEKK